MAVAILWGRGDAAIGKASILPNSFVGKSHLQGRRKGFCSGRFACVRLRVVAEAARRAGLGKRVTPHRLRHTFATRLLREVKADLVTVAALSAQSPPIPLHRPSSGGSDQSGCSRNPRYIGTYDGRTPDSSPCPAVKIAYTRNGGNKNRLAAGAGPRRRPGRWARPGNRDSTTRMAIRQMQGPPAVQITSLAGPFHHIGDSTSRRPAPRAQEG